MLLNRDLLSCSILYTRFVMEGLISEGHSFGGAVGRTGMAMQSDVPSAHT
jgi:hypothetical protein